MDLGNKQCSQTKRFVQRPVFPACVLCLIEWTWVPGAEGHSTLTLPPASSCPAHQSPTPAFSVASKYAHSLFTPFANFFLGLQASAKAVLSGTFFPHFLVNSYSFLRMMGDLTSSRQPPLLNHSWVRKPSNLSSEPPALTPAAVLTLLSWRSLFTLLCRNQHGSFLSNHITHCSLLQVLQPVCILWGEHH